MLPYRADANSYCDVPEGFERDAVEIAIEAAELVQHGQSDGVAVVDHLEGAGLQFRPEMF